MKRSLLSLAFAVMAPALFAADVVESTTTTAASSTTGHSKITAYTPGSSLVVESDKGPVTYKVGKKVRYVTRKGAVVEESRIKPGVPVTVHYEKSGPDMVVSEVVVDED